MHQDTSMRAGRLTDVSMRHNLRTKGSPLFQKNAHGGGSHLRDRELPRSKEGLVESGVGGRHNERATTQRQLDLGKALQPPREEAVPRSNAAVKADAGPSTPNLQAQQANL